MKRRVLIFLAAFLLFSQNSFAKERQRIGLVLGGGGAKAGTQVGVLKVMEELRIPVDFVVGTSMGSFIGMLYATGYPLKDIEEVLNNTDWTPIFTNQIPRDEQPTRRKEEDFSFFSKKKFGIKNGKFLVGKGIAETQQLRTLIRELTIHVANVKDFDKLPLPYRAVSVDLADGAQVILGKGELPDAVRSSMSLPGIFPPVIIDGKHLVDGGPANNLPISVAKAAGMDAVIAVDVGAGFYKPEEIESFLEVMDQLTMFLTRGNTIATYKTAGPRDVIIRPDLTGLSTESYEKIGEGFPKGEAAARAVIEKLKAFSVSEEEYAAFKAKRERPRRDPPVITSSRIDSKSDFSEPVLKNALKVDIGKPLDVKKVHKEVAQLYGFGEFSDVGYDIEPKGNGNEFVGRVVDNDSSRQYMRFGLRFYTDFKGNSSFGAGGSYNRTRINSYGAEWRTDAEVGESVRFKTEFYQPVERRLRYFVVPEVQVQRDLLTLYSGSAPTSEVLDSSVHLLFSAGRNFGNISSLRVGFEEEFGNFDNRLGTLSPIDHFNTSSYFARIYLDTVDNTNIPHKGAFGIANYKHSPDGIGSDFNFQKIDGRMVTFMPIGSKNTLSVMARGATKFGNTLPPQELFNLGGLFQLTGFQKDEKAGQHLIFGRGMFYHRLGTERLAIKSVPTYVGVSFEGGNVFTKYGDISASDMVVAGSGFIMLDTFFSPIILGGGYNSDHRGSLYLTVGRWY